MRMAPGIPAALVLLLQATLFTAPAVARLHAVNSATSTSAPAATAAAPPKPQTIKTGGDDCVDIDWTTLARSGRQYGSGVWGALKSADNKGIIRAVKDNFATPAVDISDMAVAVGTPSNYKAKPGYKFTAAVSNSPDIPTFHTAGGKTYIVNHFEEPHPATMYVSEVAPVDAKGNLKMVDTKPIPSADVGGFWFTCSGTVSPWGSHLGSEEFLPDCRAWEDKVLPCKAGVKADWNICGTLHSDNEFTGYWQFPRYYGYYARGAKYGLDDLDILSNQAAMDGFKKRFKCYNYGGTPEITVLPGGDTKVTKWFTLGRISHESALVMPDNKTVYATDDASNGVMLKFIADKPQDLTSGTMYAAKLSGQRIDAAGKPTWDVSWVELGHGQQSELERLARSDLKFSDIFETAKPSGDPLSCPEGFSATNYVSGVWAIQGRFMECLKIKPGREMAAAFLETRRFAAIKGATTQFEKMEGITFAKRFRQLYFATAKVTKGMTKDAKYDMPGRDDISLPPNRCGAVFAMDLDAKWSGDKLKVLLAGKPLPDKIDPAGCVENGLAEPDNVHYIAGNLLIQEDTTGHVNNVLWALNLEDGVLTRLVSAPPGAEVSGIYANRAGNFIYLSMTAQHPMDGEYSKEEMGLAESVESMRGYMGYLGPIPISLVEGPHGEEKVLRFSGIPVARGKDKMDLFGAKKTCTYPANGQTKPRGYAP